MGTTYCVIMAGGIGSRFWPLSRLKRPKQFLDILNTGKTLLQQTYERFLNLCNPENIYIVTSDEHIPLVKEQLPQVSSNNILGEPTRRNTAPCVAYAAYKIHKLDKNANLIIAPSDHLIQNVQLFTDTLKDALKFTAENDVLLTLGIKPTRPETGYGYIQISNEKDEFVQKFPYVRKVKVFTEKPEKKVAEAFVKSGEFLWNSGIFIGNAQAIINAMKKHSPDIADKFEEIYDFYFTEKEREKIEQVYSTVKSISFDYAVMESAKNVYVIPAYFDWSDLGTWRALYEIKLKDSDSNNVILSKNVRVYDTNQVIVNIPNKKLIVLNGVENLIIVEADDMLLISSFDNEQKLRQIVNDIRLNLGEDYV